MLKNLNHSFFRIRIYLARLLCWALFYNLGFTTVCFSQSKQFQHLTSSDGISQSEVYSFLEDSHGYLWFGTVDGLNRYDGYTITVFNTDKDNPNSIPNNTIRCLTEDEKGRIWIGTDDGLSVYNSESEEIYQISLPDYENKLLTVNSLLVVNGQIYLGTSMGLLTASIKTNSLEQIAGQVQPVQITEDNKNHNVIATELSKDKSIIWLITSSSLYSFSLEKGNIVPNSMEIVELNDELKDLRDFKEDQDGNLWIVSHDNGFLRFNPKTKELKQFQQNPGNPSIISDKISAVSVDNDGNIWIGTHDKGLLFLEKEFVNDENPNFQSIQNDPLDDRSLNSNLIYSLYVSKSNLLWIGTIGAGINSYDPYRKPFDYYTINSGSNQSLSSTNFVRAVYADNFNTIWIGTHNNGLFFLDRKNNEKITKIGFGSESIFHISKAVDENIIVCSGQGLSLVTKVGNQLKIVSTLATGPTFFATKGEGNTLWVAGLEGLKKCKIINQKIILEKEYSTSSQPKISFNNCRVLFFDKETNELFVGTEGGGLNVLHFDENHNLLNTSVYQKNENSNSISNNYIRSIRKDSNSNIWIGTYEGLNKMGIDSESGKASFKTYTNKDGLPNNTIQSIVEDNESKLWIGTNQGLCKFDPITEQFTEYTMNDGVQSNEFSEHTIFKKPDNEIIIGGINGINTFYPEHIKSSSFKPNTTITDFYVFNKKVIVANKEEDAPLTKSVSLTDSILLQPHQNSFGFEFSAMIFNAPEKIQYAYLLEGFDLDWNYTDAKNRRANYTNLDYGDYYFKVKATNNDGVWEESPKSIFVSVKTPIYYTTWAFILYGLLSILAMVFFTNYTAIKSTTKKKILLENEHNKKVQELEEFRTRFFINVSHDLRTPLTLISSPLEIVLKNKGLKPEVKTHLNLVQRNVKKLKAMTEELLDFRKAETIKPSLKTQKLDIVSFVKSEVSFFEHAIQDKGIRLKITSDEEVMVIGFDSDMISKVISNILSNALKHTDKGEIAVAISNVSSKLSHKLKDAKHENFVRIQVQDTGAGIETSDLEKIFERFYQGKEQSVKGYGVGLSHCKDLIEAHDGIIDVTSAKGVGSTFSIYLPTTLNEIELSGEQPLSAIVLDADELGLISDSDTEETTIAKSKKILLVEDNVDLRNFIGSELRKKYKVIEAPDGEKGLELATEQFPDLIISDVMMPKMNGLEFCKEIKSDIKTSHIPVILLTAKVNKESKYEGIEIGADDYVSKPFEMDYIFLRINNLLKNRERLRKQFQVSTNFEPSAITVTSLDEKFLSTLLSKIEEGIPDSEFTVSALEDEMGMSHSSFYNKIKSLTGQSAKELLLNMRMKRAKQVLEDTTDIRISEVAFMVGFSDPKYFSKCFKEYHGKSPSEFIKK